MLMHGLIRSSTHVSMDMIQMQMQLENKMMCGGTAGKSDVIPDLGGRDDAERRLMQLKLKGMEGDHHPQAMEESSSQRPRRRKRDVEKGTIVVPAPQFGNTETPPDDGFSWRKYGQKGILGSRFPRFSPTAIIPRSSQLLPAPTSISTITSPGWLSMDLSQRDSGGATAGPSTTTTTRYGGREIDHYQVVADMADAMFNDSGSSGGNNMDFLLRYSCMEDKWEQQGDKKK
ncbi:WRKY transcription factor 55 [Quillaja saponaria]|uniref:WRKY transcription factor 55 n=1 Tax=Quillaja saponaria TaxID=32244 RepID=A0AAD7LK11_QUISA|nr:WRKY transcription factor 55 [Quillaja saponaria]